ncbi:CDP-alcohol phosphatidyltransferase family protein [uncultured Jatrophihabitans sp.]|uniref:CDP-alcohol phosphatidyltransferase family protein n=1 Tax=uncultured Jatrophihabitans sp. TaxID=1610747 RepID=UPI0035C9EBC3
MSGWLSLMWSGGRVLARHGVAPTAVTAAGVTSATLAVGVARSSPVAAGAAVLLAAVCDGLDGATAVVADRATRSGALADAVADRYCDATFAAVMWRCGVPPRLAAGCGALAWAVDGVRRVRRIPWRITVAERPTFTICALLACAADAAAPLPVLPCALVWAGLCGIGLGQLSRTPTH